LKNKFRYLREEKLIRLQILKDDLKNASSLIEPSMGTVQLFEKNDNDILSFYIENQINKSQ